MTRKPERRVIGSVLKVAIPSPVIGRDIRAGFCSLMFFPVFFFRFLAARRGSCCCCRFKLLLQWDGIKSSTCLLKICRWSLLSERGKGFHLQSLHFTCTHISKSLSRQGLHEVLEPVGGCLPMQSPGDDRLFEKTSIMQEQDGTDEIFRFCDRFRAVGRDILMACSLSYLEPLMGGMTAALIGLI
jgi:hypothetical protein